MSTQTPKKSLKLAANSLLTDTAGCYRVGKFNNRPSVLADLQCISCKGIPKNEIFLCKCGALFCNQRNTLACPSCPEVGKRSMTKESKRDGLNPYCDTCDFTMSLSDLGEHNCSAGGNDEQPATSSTVEASEQPATSSTLEASEENTTDPETLHQEDGMPGLANAFEELRVENRQLKENLTERVESIEAKLSAIRAALQ